MSGLGIRLVGLDIDGTLLTSAGQLTSRTEQAIRACIAAGCLVAPASGRPWGGLPGAFTSIPGVDWAVTANGATLVNLAAGQVAERRWMTREDWLYAWDLTAGFDRVMDLNVKGMFHCARGAVPWMERQGRGVILNTSSMVSFYGQPAGVAYPVSKFAVNGFTLSLARELAPKGIRVNAVAPGIIETDMLRAVPREVLAPLEAQIPLGRVGQPGEVAEAFVFLASEQASYITGVVLRVDGLARA